MMYIPEPLRLHRETEASDMGITKKIKIDDKEVAFKASAAIPRIYRMKFQRDIYKDLASLEKAVGEMKRGSQTLTCSPLRCSRT